MTDKPLDPVSVHPLAQWADLGWRALDATVASSQHLGDGVDRMTRAVARADVPEADARARELPSGAAVPASSMALATTLQRSALEQMTRGWLHWVSTCSAFVALASGRSGAATQPSPEETAQPVRARPPRTGRAPATTGLAPLEHALAQAEPRRARRTARVKARSRTAKAG